MKISQNPAGNILLSTKFWPLAALVAVAPIFALAGGCGGGSGGLLGVRPTPSPTTVPAVVLFSNARLDLGNGQIGTLNATRIGNAVTGTLLVANNVSSLAKSASSATSGTNALVSFHIPPNIYNITGTFSPPSGFTLSGTFPAPIGPFTLNGQVPTTTQAGSFTLAAAGQTQTGTIPALSVPIPTPVPTTGPTAQPTAVPTATPPTNGGSLRTSGGGSDTLSLTGTGSGVGANFSEGGFFAIVTSNGATQLQLEGTTVRNNTSPYRDIKVSVFKTGTINVGDSFPIGPTTGQRASVLISYDATGSGNGTVYYGVSGTLTITGATATGFSVSLSNVKINGIGAATGGTNDFHTFSIGSATGTYN